MRPLSMISLLAVLAAPWPSTGKGADDPEKLFRKMEENLTGAKTLRVSADVLLKVPEGELKIVGDLHFADGDRVNLTLNSTVDGKTRKGTTVSDGKRIRWTTDGSSGHSLPTAPGLNRFFVAKFARAGLGFGFFLTVGDGKVAGKDIDTLYPATDFRLRGKAQVRGRTAQVIEHKLTWAGKEPVFRATVWVDAVTGVPLKRVLTGEKKGQTVHITEVYADAALNGKLDTKLFDLPK